MPTTRHLLRTAAVLTAALGVTLTATAGLSSSDEQESTVQRLLERGALQEAVDVAGRDSGNPESTFLAAQALISMNNGGAASERFAQLRESGDGAWKAIGESGVALQSGNLGAAMEAANRAVSAEGGNPYAHYQKALVAARQNNLDAAVQAYERSLELKPDLAYAHYYAAQSYQRLKRNGNAADHYQMFLKLAPNAPERQGVLSILRTIG
jgi:tetratricopeptide (TPR) repeat protein